MAFKIFLVLGGEVTPYSCKFAGFVKRRLGERKGIGGMFASFKTRERRVSL